MTLGFIFLTIAAAAAAQSPLDSMRACTAEKNEGARLACYDRAMAALNPQQPEPAPQPVVVPAADEFGMTEELRRKRNPEQAKVEVTPELRARVVSVQRRQGNALRVELENGQVWVENEHKDGLLVNEGDLVTVKPGLLGSYFLSLDSGVASRVRRVR